MAEIQLLAAPPDDDRRPSDDRRPPDSAWQRMHALRSAWPEGDGVAVFNGLCLSGAGDITASYGGGYPTTASTRDAAALRSSLAERYLAAVDAVDVGGRAPPPGGRSSSTGVIRAYGRRSSRSRASTRTWGTIWRSRWWTCAGFVAANRRRWKRRSHGSATRSRCSWIASASRRRPVRTRARAQGRGSGDAPARGLERGTGPGGGLVVGAGALGTA